MHKKPAAKVLKLGAKPPKADVPPPKAKFVAVGAPHNGDDKDPVNYVGSSKDARACKRRGTFTSRAYDKCVRRTGRVKLSRKMYKLAAEKWGKVHHKFG